MTDDFPTVGDLTVSDDGECSECGAAMLGSFSIATIDDEGVNDFGTWAGCWACVLFEYLKGLEQ